MYNEITRKLTSLTLMTIMVAGGMAVAFPGMEPAYAAGDLYVSAEAVGNFAGIQVLEIVVSDPDRSSTNESEGIPNVEINGDDVRMAQGSDGSWYAYVANEIALDAFDAFDSDTNTNATSIFKAPSVTTGTDLYIASLSGSDAITIYNNTEIFLQGFKELQDGTPDNNPNIEDNDWPFIQTYDISDNTDVTITYGTGSTADSVTIKYEYDDSKDVSFDRTRYPASSDVILTLDDSLLNLSPIADDFWAFNSSHVFYFQENDLADTYDTISKAYKFASVSEFQSIGFEEGPLTYNVGSNTIFSIKDSKIHDDIKETGGTGEGLIILRESDINDNIFVNYDTGEKANIITNSDNKKTGSGTIEYNDNHSIILDTFDGVIKFALLVDEWLSGVELNLELIDEDKNFSSLTDEDLLILVGEVPFIKIGDPITLGTFLNTDESFKTGYSIVDQAYLTVVTENVTSSQVADLLLPAATTTLFINATWPSTENYKSNIDNGNILPYINYDFTAFNGTKGTFYAGTTTGADVNGFEVDAPNGINVYSNGDEVRISVDVSGIDISTPSIIKKAYFDVLFYGQVGALTTSDGKIDDNVDRVNDAIYRFELEETDDNTAKFTGTVEYLMINQINVYEPNTYESIETADDQLVIIVNDDMDGVDAIRVSYNDVDSTGNDETISVQEDANTHSGTITFDTTSYSSGNTITVTLTDADLNTDSDTPQIYDVDPDENWVGNSDVWLTQLLFDNELYAGCDAGSTFESTFKQKDMALNNTGFSFIETSKASGVFVGTFQLPTKYCDKSNNPAIPGSDFLGNTTTNGVDIKMEYQDYSDASGNPNESSTKAAVSSNTGSVSLDKTVYGLPIGEGKDDSGFALHPSSYKNGVTEYLDATPTTITIRVDDSDYNVSANGEDTIPLNKVELFVKRGSDSTVNLLAGLPGAFVEIDPQSGIFEYDLEINQRTSSTATLESATGFIKQGDIISVVYTDDNDASGEINTVTDSATFDLRNGVLQADKSVYIIGSDAIITLIEPDFNLDSDTEETLSLDLIEWDSDAGTTTLANSIFDAQPAGLRETGPDSGIFQVVIEIPKEIDQGDTLERGEQIFLEYVDNGPAGADYVGDDDEDIEITIYTSNFGATIELDQKVYTWTDKVYVTVVAPDHNFDNNAIDEIGGVDKVVQITTREDKIKDYKFVETGPDTGIFTGEFILTGFCHDSDGDASSGKADSETGCGNGDDTDPRTSGNGPTDGFLKSGDDDGLTVSFEFSDNETATGSALIRWNIGEVQWLEASYPASGTGVVRTIDPDMNLNPESVDSFDINVWSDSSAGGIALRITETNEATGIFEGTVIFTTTDSSSGSRLRVAEGDTVTAEYEDNTLPDPYSTADELGITATTLIGTIVPPLERAPASNLKPVDAFGNSLSTVAVDQQVQLTADLSNNQDREQKFAYLLQVQDKNGVTVALSWITGELTPGQQLSPAVSWIPTEIGTYTATVFVWESVDNPTALSPPVKTEIVVNN